MCYLLAGPFLSLLNMTIDGYGRRKMLNRSYSGGEMEEIELMGGRRKNRHCERTEGARAKKRTWLDRHACRYQSKNCLSGFLSLSLPFFFHEIPVYE